MPKVKYKERILKAAKEKQLVSYKGAPIILSADISKESAVNKVRSLYSQSSVVSGSFGN